MRKNRWKARIKNRSNVLASSQTDRLSPGDVLVAKVKAADPAGARVKLIAGAVFGLSWFCSFIGKRNLKKGRFVAGLSRRMDLRDMDMDVSLLWFSEFSGLSVIRR